MRGARARRGAGCRTCEWDGTMGPFCIVPHGLGPKKVAQTVNASDDPSAVMLISDEDTDICSLQTQPSREKKKI